MEVETPNEAGARAGTGPEIPWREIAPVARVRAAVGDAPEDHVLAVGVFVVALGTFLICCAYARPFMRRSVDGGLTVAYL